jgi:hypothetical protein
VARRDLSEVLHYFIPEEEQRLARAAPVATPAAAPARSLRLAMLVSFARPLVVGLAIDLACAWACERHVRVISPIEPHPLLPRSKQIRWRTAPDLAKALGEPGDPSPAFVLLPAASTSAELARLADAGLQGLIVPLEGASTGVARALGVLRRLGPAAGVRVGALAIGGGRGDPSALLRSFESASRRQLGIEVETLGALERDPDAYRSLLQGVAAAESGADAGYARSLRQIGERL